MHQLERAQDVVLHVELGQIVEGEVVIRLRGLAEIRGVICGLELEAEKRL